MNREWRHDRYVVSTDAPRLDLETFHDLSSPTPSCRDSVAECSPLETPEIFLERKYGV